ncbi:MAG: hypothetical protein IJJ82_07120 [Clostridia bacterium]|nr:hypothetical protein [Clostridia bacterium]
MNLTKWERYFLNYYMNKYKAKWMRVFNNKHPFLATTVDFFTIYKRHLKQQAETGKETYTNMFETLIAGEWYFIPHLLENNKEE